MRSLLLSLFLIVPNMYSSIVAQTKEIICSDFPSNPSWLVVIEAGERRFAGTLINERAVLTAAHLLNNTQVVTVEINGKKSNVTKTHEHSRFNSRLMYFDLAILEFGDSFDAAPVCLPDQDNEINYSQCFAVVMKNTGEVQRLPLETLTRATCERRLRRRLGASFELHSSFRCAKGSCQVHGGSALMCPSKYPDDKNETGWFYLGLSSWGLECATSPEIYVDVKYVLVWIQTVLTKRLSNND